MSYLLQHTRRPTSRRRPSRVDTVLGALTRSRDGLIAEAALYAERERHT